MDPSLQTPVDPTPQGVNPSDAAPATPPVAEPINPSAAARQALYQRLYAAGNPPAQAEPVVVDTPVAETPAAPEPVATTDPVPTPDPVTGELQALRQQVLELTQRLTTPPQAPSEPTPAAPTPTEADWLELMRQGDREGADKALAQMVMAKAGYVDPKQVITAAVEQMQAHQELTAFTNEVRQQNPELVQMERWIAPAVRARLAEAEKAGKIKSTADHVREYKSAVNEELAEARKVLQLSRAAGKTEAQVSQSRVIAASTIPPQAVDANRGVPQAPPAAPDVSPESYLQKRLARSHNARGLFSGS